ncbi:hypothetical protein HDU76_013793 [Blyttiomyces sp. JEL0837]|nr:hypothetical protein HDU76_013793 [Blyttiomyces sp. JEL0837]
MLPPIDTNNNLTTNDLPTTDEDIDINVSDVLLLLEMIVTWHPEIQLESTDNSDDGVVQMKKPVSSSVLNVQRGRKRALESISELYYAPPHRQEPMLEHVTEEANVIHLDPLDHPVDQNTIVDIDMHLPSPVLEPLPVSVAEPIPIATSLASALDTSDMVVPTVTSTLADQVTVAATSADATSFVETTAVSAELAFPTLFIDEQDHVNAQHDVYDEQCLPVANEVLPVVETSVPMATLSTLFIDERNQLDNQDFKDGHCLPVSMSLLPGVEPSVPMATLSTLFIDERNQLENQDFNDDHCLPVVTSVLPLVEPSVPMASLSTLFIDERNQVDVQQDVNDDHCLPVAMSLLPAVEPPVPTASLSTLFIDERNQVEPQQDVNDDNHGLPIVEPSVPMATLSTLFIDERNQLDNKDVKDDDHCLPVAMSLLPAVEPSSPTASLSTLLIDERNQVDAEQGVNDDHCLPVIESFAPPPPEAVAPTVSLSTIFIDERTQVEPQQDISMDQNNPIVPSTLLPVEVAEPTLFIDERNQVDVQQDVNTHQNPIIPSTLLPVDFAGPTLFIDERNQVEPQQDIKTYQINPIIASTLPPVEPPALPTLIIDQQPQQTDTFLNPAIEIQPSIEASVPSFEGLLSAFIDEGLQDDVDYMQSNTISIDTSDPNCYVKPPWEIDATIQNERAMARQDLGGGGRRRKIDGLRAYTKEYAKRTWEGLSDVEKEPFEQQAAASRQRYREEMKLYRELTIPAASKSTYPLSESGTSSTKRGLQQASNIKRRKLSQGGSYSYSDGETGHIQDPVSIEALNERIRSVCEGRSFMDILVGDVDLDL